MAKIKKVTLEELKNFLQQDLEKEEIKVSELKQKIKDIEESEKIFK